MLNVLEKSQVSPPPASVTNTSLPLTFFDIFWLQSPPIQFLFFYDLPLSKSQFTQTIVPNLKHSLSITLQHFFPYAGNLFIFPTPTRRKPEIRYVQGDSVTVTFAESNLDFHDLVGYHPRNCDKFYHLIPALGDCCKTPDQVTIPAFSLQVTLFPNSGISIGLHIHHSLVDATTQFNFLKAWTSIARCGTDKSFLSIGTLPIYERLVNYPERDESFLHRAKLETLFEEDYQLPRLSGPTDKVRATFLLKRTFIDQLKKRVSTELPSLPYVSSFTVACAYIWCCLAKSRNDERQLFIIPINCRARLDPQIPTSYFGNCISGCRMMAMPSLLTGNDGFLGAAAMIGESLHKWFSDGVLNDKVSAADLLSDGIPTAVISIAGSPKLNLYDVDFGWGKPKTLERISLDYTASFSIDPAKESDQDFEIGVCLKSARMDDFAHHFNLGLE